MRGILKKPASAAYPRRGAADTLGVRGNAGSVGARGAAGVQRSFSAHANLNSVRDSVDLAREQLSDRSARRAKVSDRSVRRAKVSDRSARRAKVSDC